MESLALELLAARRRLAGQNESLNEQLKNLDFAQGRGMLSFVGVVQQRCARLREVIKATEAVISELETATRD